MPRSFTCDDQKIHRSQEAHNEHQAVLPAASYSLPLLAPRDILQRHTSLRLLHLSAVVHYCAWYASFVRSAARTAAAACSVAALTAGSPLQSPFLPIN